MKKSYGIRKYISGKIDNMLITGLTESEAVEEYVNLMNATYKIEEVIENEHVKQEEIIYSPKKNYSVCEYQSYTYPNIRLRVRVIDFEHYVYDIVGSGISNYTSEEIEVIKRKMVNNYKKYETRINRLIIKKGLKK